MIPSHFSTNPALTRRSLFHMIGAGSLAIIAAALIAGCGKKQAGSPGGPGGPGGPMEVSVLTIAPAPVTLTQDLPGRISAFRVAEVRARVNGIVLKRLFTEGSDVAEGQVLYEIDPAPYQAALDSALGTLARAEANATTARLKEERFKQLLTAKAISKQDYDDALANERTYDADVLSGKAAVQAARITLDYTKVTSPITGRIGISQVTEGAYVQASAANLLATVQQLDRVYVDVTQASSELLRLRRDLASGRLKADETGKASREAHPRRRRDLSGRGLAGGFRRDGECDDEFRHGARDFPEPARRAAARFVCARAAGGRQFAGRDPRAATRGEPQLEGRADDAGRGRERHGRAARASDSASGRQSMAGHRGIEAGRPSHRGQSPEASVRARRSKQSPAAPSQAPATVSIAR